MDSPEWTLAGDGECGGGTGGAGAGGAVACTMGGEEVAVTIDCEGERDVDMLVPETFARRDDINTDDDDAVEIAIEESLIINM